MSSDHENRRTAQRRGLGRGLSALMADVRLDPGALASGEGDDRHVMRIPIERLHPNPDQPRRSFDPATLEELAGSIREKGVLQPLIVRPAPAGDGGYQIVAGERRWRAAQMAQLHEVPALVRDLDDTEVLEVAIIENVQRADLNPIEEAAGYRQLMERFGHTQEALARALGKSRSHLANLLRLLSLPPEVQDHLREGRLSAGHARALVTADDPASLARRIIREGLSVRAVERLMQASAAGRSRGQDRQPRYMIPGSDADTRAMERDLSAQIGLKVRIDHRPGSESGQVIIRYDTLDQLDIICGMFNLRERNRRFSPSVGTDED